MNICICGGGNLGHVMAGFLAVHSFCEVSILTGHPDKWSNELELIINDSARELQTLRSHICKISSSPEDVIPLADLVFICLPGPFIRKTLERIKPYLKRDVIVGSVVSNTGFFFQAHDIISEFSIFGFQRVPFICRIKEYGKKAVLLGFKKSLSVCVENGDGEYIRSLLETLLQTPVRLLNNYYEATLSNSNPLLHPSRLYTMWNDWSPSVTYERVPLFYSEWTDDASQLLIDMDAELQELLVRLSVNRANIPPILDYYESVDAKTLTYKIKSIPAFKEILSPMRQLGEGGFVPDLNSRYFTEDFEYGTFFIRETARRNDLATPKIDMVCKWYENIKNLNSQN